jgi:hypothetical protein
MNRARLGLLSFGLSGLILLLAPVPAEAGCRCKPRTTTTYPSHPPQTNHETIPPFPGNCLVCDHGTGLWRNPGLNEPCIMVPYNVGDSCANPIPIPFESRPWGAPGVGAPGCSPAPPCWSGSSCCGSRWGRRCR